MILNFLNQFRKANNSIRKLRLCDNFERIGDPSLKSIDVIIYKEDILMIAPCDYGEMAYFLPWKKDTGFYIDLPKNAPQASIFLTSELSGCFVGVQDMGDFYRIRHYNFMTVNADVNDLQRFDDEHHLINWLAPNRDNIGQMLTGAHVPHELYTGYSAGNPVLFWGEYINNDWVFYYQATDNTVHRFLVFKI